MKIAAELCLLVANWGGEEIARLLVLASDIVRVGMIQIEEQIGVAPRNQRLVLGEKLLEENVMWSEYGVVNWSTIQFTTIVEVSADEYINHTSITKPEYIKYSSRISTIQQQSYISTIHQSYFNNDGKQNPLLQNGDPEIIPANVATLLPMMHERSQKRKTIKMEGKDCDGGKLPKTKSGEAVSFHDYKLKSSLIYFFVGNSCCRKCSGERGRSQCGSSIIHTMLGRSSCYCSSSSVCG